MDFSPVDKEITAAVETGVFPGAVVLVNRAGTVVYRRAFGWRSLEPERTPLSAETSFDLASLTKPLAITVAIMLMVKEKKLQLDDQVTRFFPDLDVPGKASLTFRHLLSHSSGLPAWRPYYQEVVAHEAKGGKLDFLSSRSAREFVYGRLGRENLEAPPGHRAMYSDLGFMMLGAVIEKNSGLGLDQYCQEKIFRPLGLPALSFLNLEMIRRHGPQPVLERYAPTEYCPWRKRILCAEVHDDNAYAMGGVAGHAGLFAPVDEVDRLMSVLLACYRGESTFLPSTLVREFWTRAEIVPDSTWCLGWDSPSSPHSSAGEFFSPHSVGHLGFTGTSIWIDLEHQVHVILLSNRLHPNRDNNKIQTFRPALHNTVMKVVLGRSS